MLAYGSHSDSSLMRADWNIRELRRPLQPAFEFARPQGNMIRHRLRGWVPGPSANATQ